MYQASSAQAPKRDATATARSPIRRSTSRWSPSRPSDARQRGSTHRQPPSPEPTYREPFSVHGNYRMGAADAPQEPAETSSAGQPWTVPGAHRGGPSARNGVVHTTVLPAEPVRRMQVTRQRATRRANLEAERSMGRFVVRPILNEEEDAEPQPWERPQSPTVDPMDLLVVRSSRRRARPGNARSRSPVRLEPSSGTVRVAFPNQIDGLGDRHRSPSGSPDGSPSMEDSDWETLRATIPPDEQLPSATSSFTSTTASTSSLSLDQSASQQSIATSRTSASVNHRYVMPTAECLDITDAQLECGVVCDDARDARPPFAPSEGPSRQGTESPTTGNGGGAGEPSHAIPTPPVRSNGTPAPERRWRRRAREEDDTNSVAAVHLRSPSLEEQSRSTTSGRPSLTNFSNSSTTTLLAAYTHPRPASGVNLSAALRTSRATVPSLSSLARGGALQSSPPLASAATVPSTTAISSSAAPIADPASPPAEAVSTRLAEVQLQWQQLRRINELLQCGREVPGWLWEVAGLAPELSPDLTEGLSGAGLGLGLEG